MKLTHLSEFYSVYMYIEYLADSSNIISAILSIIVEFQAGYKDLASFFDSLMYISLSGSYVFLSNIGLQLSQSITAFPKKSLVGTRSSMSFAIFRKWWSNGTFWSYKNHIKNSFVWTILWYVWYMYLVCIWRLLRGEWKSFEHAEFFAITVLFLQF